jgi:hypothetical protein
MLEWIRRALSFSHDDGRQRFFEKVDALNAQIGGGRPGLTQWFLGHLKLRSGTLAFGDPQYPLPMQGPNLQLPGVAASAVGISARLWRYPSGKEQVTGLTLRLGDEADAGPSRKIGEIGIDSAKLVVADMADLEDYWTDVGKDRIGVISTAPDDTVLRLLTRRFKLKTVRVNRICAHIVGAVSEQLEKEIEDYLKSDPKYADFPYMHFRVETNNSFERANRMEKAWDFIPVGNEDAPLMFVCSTGRGDGLYDVNCTFSKNVPRVVSIEFIEEGATGLGPA